MTKRSEWITAFKTAEANNQNTTAQPVKKVGTQTRIKTASTEANTAVQQKTTGKARRAAKKSETNATTAASAVAPGEPFEYTITAYDHGGEGPLSCVLKNHEFIMHDTALVKYIGHARKVHVPAGTTFIVSNAFPDCVETVFLPDTVVGHETHAFDRISEIKQAATPKDYTLSDDGVLTISRGVLSGREIYFGYEDIGPEENYALINSLGADFYKKHAYGNCGGIANGCDKIHKIIVKEGCTEIQDGAFGGCTTLQTVTLPSSVTSISDGAFVFCPGLQEVQIAEGNRYYCSVDGCIYTADMETLVYIPAAKTEVHLPDTLKQIGCGEHERNGVFDSALHLWGDRGRALTDIYYSGTEEQWRMIRIGERHHYLWEKETAIHCGLVGEKKKQDCIAASNDAATDKAQTAAESAAQVKKVNVPVNGDTPPGTQHVSETAPEISQTKAEVISQMRDSIIRVITDKPCLYVHVDSLEGDDLRKLKYNVMWEYANYFLNLKTHKLEVTLETDGNGMTQPVYTSELTAEEYQNYVSEFGAIAGCETQEDLETLFEERLNKAITKAETAMKKQEIKQHEAEAEKYAVAIPASLNHPGMIIQDLSISFNNSLDSDSIHLFPKEAQYQIEGSLHRNPTHYKRHGEETSAARTLTSHEAAWIEDRVETALRTQDDKTLRFCRKGYIPGNMEVMIKIKDKPIIKRHGTVLKNYYDLFDNLRNLTRYGSRTE